MIEYIWYTEKKCGVSERPRGAIFHVSMVTHTVTMETGKYCSPGATVTPQCMSFVNWAWEVCPASFDMSFIGGFTVRS